MTISGHLERSDALATQPTFSNDMSHAMSTLVAETNLALSGESRYTQRQDSLPEMPGLALFLGLLQRADSRLNSSISYGLPAAGRVMGTL